MRFTESGTPNTTANYDYAYKIIETATGFENFPATNQTYFRGVRYGTIQEKQVMQHFIYSI